MSTVDYPVAFDLKHGPWVIAHDLEATAHVQVDDDDEIYVVSIELNGVDIEFGSTDPIERLIYTLGAAAFYRDEANFVHSEQWCYASNHAA